MKKKCEEEKRKTKGTRKQEKAVFYLSIQMPLGQTKNKYIGRQGTYMYMSLHIS